MVNAVKQPTDSPLPLVKPPPNPSGKIHTKEQLIEEYPDCFKGIGRFPGTHKIHLQEGGKTVIHSQQKWPIAMHDKLKAKLDQMEKDEIITQVTEPTDWVNSLAYLWKPDSDLQVCLDPKDLNKVTKRTYHNIPTVEEVIHAFAGSKFFSKLDAKSAFWCIRLEEESSYLTTFGTTFGRYHYLVMPYCSTDSQDAFLAKMDQILEGLEGVVSITNDIIVHGVTEEQHDKNMRNLMDCTLENGLVFNPDKCSLKADSVMFFRCLYDRNGIRPDQAKVKAIQAMPAPTCLHELQEFIGMVTYLSKFIRDLSNLQEPLHALTKKDVWFE